MTPVKAERVGISPAGNTAVARSINAMSRPLAPLYAPIANEFAGPAGWGGTARTLNRLMAAAKIYNRALDQLMPELAQLTNNSPSTLRMVFRPTDEYSVGTTPGKLGTVAHCRLFNDRLWTLYSGIQRPPTYPYVSFFDVAPAGVVGDMGESELFAAPSIG